ncbi:MAG TPA: tetratricopeptide repeat protein, partial [Thermoanaerobaculia bacterium]|nr:tetratricopeptide repeat protein [Thermoanaerobaculia bacterium]
YDSLARDYLRTHAPDLTILYLQGTDSVGHMFAPYTAPRQPNISEEDFNRYSQVPELYFRHIDELLGDYKASARERGARIVIASDHGFHWIEGRPTELSSFAASTAAKWHRKHGMYVLWGPGIAASRSRSEDDASESRVAQLCATLLALEQMPPATGIDEPPFRGVAAAGQPVDYRAHYQPAKPVVSEDASTSGAAEEIAKLKALGYIGSTEATSAPAALAGRSTHTAGWHNNRALILRNDKKLDAAQKEYEEAIAIDPNLSSALWNLSDLLHTEKRDLDRADALLVKAVAKGLPEGVNLLIGRAIGYQRNGMLDRSVKLLEAAVTEMPDNGELLLFRGRYRIERRDCAGALADFQRASQLAPDNPVPYASAGVAEICLGDTAAAQRSFARSLQLDPNQPKLRAFLATAAR